MATANRKDNVPAIVTLFHELQRVEAKVETLGRDIVMDFYHNAATVNLELLAIGNASDVGTVHRMQWLERNIPEHKSDVDALAALKKPKPTDGVEAAHAYAADKYELERRIGQRRSMMNRAVPAAFYLVSRNATGVSFIGSKKNKILFTFEQDTADKVTAKPVIDKEGKTIPVGRGSMSLTLGDLKNAGDMAITAHIAKRAETGAPVKAPTKRKPKASATSAATTTTQPLKETPAIIAAAEVMAASLAGTTGDKLHAVAETPQVETMLCQSVRARFGKFDKVTGSLKSIDIGELFTWLKSQAFFKDVVWTGHATTAEVIRPATKPVTKPAETPKADTAKPANNKPATKSAASGK